MDNDLINGDGPETTCIGGPLDGQRLRRSRTFTFSVYGQQGARLVHVYHLIVGKFFYLGVARDEHKAANKTCAPGRRDPGPE